MGNYNSSIIKRNTAFYSQTNIDRNLDRKTAHFLKKFKNAKS